MQPIKKRWVWALVMLAVTQSIAAQTMRSEVKLKWSYEPPSITFGGGVVEPSVEEFIIYATETLPTGTNLQSPARTDAWKEVARISAVESWGGGNPPD